MRLALHVTCIPQAQSASLRCKRKVELEVELEVRSQSVRSKCEDLGARLRSRRKFPNPEKQS